MSYAELLDGLGFTLDPFATTNADEEERLEDYFVAPPFFSAVYGQPDNPKSAIVFAPRGGGKTALKRKIELASADESYLCVTYNAFNIADRALKDIDSAYHLNNLVELVLVAVITAAHVKGVTQLDNTHRHLLYLLTKAHLSDIDQAELKQAIRNVKTFSDQAKDVWNAFTGPIGVVINSLLENIGLGSTEIQKFEEQGGQLGGYIDRLRVLQSMAQTLGYSSIYILVDKVDENALTGSADHSYKFIAPILTDLQLLEIGGYAFKLFLWNLMLDDYREVARPDRVKYYSLEWNYVQIRYMLSERLKAHSNGRISSFADILAEPLPFDLDVFIAILAQGSPRNMVRIGKEILDQQSELNSGAHKVSLEAVHQGLLQIANNISHETFSDTIVKDLQRTKRCDFTIRHVYSIVFKFTQPAGLSKVRGWQKKGAVIQLGTTQETEGAKPSNHYGIRDMLLARHVFSELSTPDFYQSKVRICPSCDAVLLRDWDVSSPQHCNHCQHEVS